MSDLLQQLSTFLNLSKLVAVTLPGIVATVALLLFLNPPACAPDPPQTCWYCQGQQKDSSAAKAPAVSTTRPQGSFMVSKLTWRQTNPYQLLARVAKTTDLKVCADVPEYIIPTSRLTAAKDTIKNLGDLEAIDPAFLFDTLEQCNSALTVAAADLNRRDSAENNIITSLNSRLTGYTTNLQAAKAAANKLQEDVFQKDVNQAKEDLASESQVHADLQSALTAEASLAQQIAAAKTPLSTNVTSTVPVDTPPAKTTWQAAAQAIGNNVFMFIVVCLVVGQLLDPIQRAFISWDPIRGVMFPFLNFLFRADQPIGMVRFGDQSYQTTRRADVDPMLRKEPYLLDPSYAIGKGLLTQAEYGSMQDQYFSQSQITTGMMLPTALLAAAAYFRIICCNPDQAGPGVFLWALFCLTALLALLGLVVKTFLRKGEAQYAENMRQLRERMHPNLKGKDPEPVDPMVAKAEEAEARIHQARSLRGQHNAAYGTLLEQFRSDQSNPRQDEYRSRLERDEEDRKLLEQFRADTRKLREQEDQRAEERRLREKEDRETSELNWRAIVTGNEKGRRWLSLVTFIFGPIAFVAVIGALVLLGYCALSDWMLAGLAVGLPALEVLFFLGGIDRLHNFYSVVQARIVGAAKKAEESNMKKFADLLTDKKSKQDFLAELVRRREQIDVALNLYREGQS